MPHDIPAQNQSPALLSAQLARGFASALGEALAPLGLAPAQFVVLMELWRADSLTQRDLARRLDLEQATMANTLARMARDGLVTREPHPRDSRARLITLTERAKALKKPAKAAARAVNAQALGGLSRKEEERFLDLLQRVTAALQMERHAHEDHLAASGD